VIEADAAQAQGSLLLPPRLGNDHDGLDPVQERAGPGGVLAAQAYVDTAYQVPLGKFRRIAHIEQLHPHISQTQQLVERNWMQHPLKVAVERLRVRGYSIVRRR
jgi:hypothetical protein